MNNIFKYIKVDHAEFQLFCDINALLTYTRSIFQIQHSVFIINNKSLLIRLFSDVS